MTVSHTNFKKTKEGSFKIVNFYRFMAMGDADDLQALRSRLKDSMVEGELKGTVLLAGEGINATIAGDIENIDRFVSNLANELACEFEIKASFADALPFAKTEVKVKSEIVTLKREVEIELGKGTHVSPEEWNDLISDPDVLLLDTRNDYEVVAGRFHMAVDPEIEKFSDLPNFIETALNPQKHQKVAIYCTGGIRCEKFAPYLLERGFQEVYQLDGGILRYLETVPAEESLWEGECFVFDRRISVDSDLQVGNGIDPSQAPEKRERTE